MTRSALRSSIATVFWVVVSFFLAAPAFAQDGDALPTNWKGWLVLVVVAIVPAAIAYLRATAHKTENQIDDYVLSGLLSAKQWYDENREIVERWKDPNDPEVPRGPTVIPNEPVEPDRN